jgi:hypothetical protein
MYGEGYGTGLPNDCDYSDVELRALPVLAAHDVMRALQIAGSQETP